MLDRHPTYKEMQEILALLKIKKIEMRSRNGDLVCLCIDTSVFERFGVKFLDRVSTPQGNGTVIGIGDLVIRPYGRENLWFLLDEDVINNKGINNKGISYWNSITYPQNLVAHQISLLTVDDKRMQQPIDPCFLEVYKNCVYKKYSYWIYNYQLNEKQAQAIQAMVLRTWFLYAHELVDKNILPLEIFIHIASYLTAPTLPTHELTDLFQKYVSGRYQRFFNDRLKKKSDQSSDFMNNISHSR